MWETSLTTLESGALVNTQWRMGHHPVLSTSTSFPSVARTLSITGPAKAFSTASTPRSASPFSNASITPAADMSGISSYSMPSWAQSSLAMASVLENGMPM